MLHSIFSLVLFSIFFTQNGYAQCELISEMNANGTISISSQSELLYNNVKYQMYSQVKYDGVDYYLVWIVKPLELKSIKPEKMEVLLDNDSTIVLDFYGSYTSKKDTSVNFLYRVKNEQVLLLSQHEIHSIKFDAELGIKHFILKLHKDQIQAELNCILNSLKKE